jgi:hypothetical protein
MVIFGQDRAAVFKVDMCNTYQSSNAVSTAAELIMISKQHEFAHTLPRWAMLS